MVVRRDAARASNDYGPPEDLTLSQYSDDFW